MTTLKYQITEPRKNVGIYEDRRLTTDNMIYSLQYDIMKNL